MYIFIYVKSPKSNILIYLIVSQITILCIFNVNILND